MKRDNAIVTPQMTAIRLTYGVKINDTFNKASRAFSNFTGSALAFGLAVLVIVVWIIYAIPKGFSNESQMPINSLTTIVTFLMVFLIQNSQNHDAKALHVKLDEILIKLKETDTSIAAVEDKSEEELAGIKNAQIEEIRQNTPAQTKSD